EFPRAVIAVSDPKSAYELIQHAMNLAEEFQIPIVVLSEKTICETQTMVDPFKHKAIPIKRGLTTDKKELAALKPEDRYRITENGVSKRWIPGSSEVYYDANGDEHWESGVLTEDGEKVKVMIAKRMKKMEPLKASLPEPTVYGTPKNADISFVGWGSSKGAVLDAIEEAEAQGVKVNYLHFDYLWPLKTETLEKFFKENKNVCLMEGNYQGQLGELIKKETGLTFKKRFLKWDGRPFFVDEVVVFINENK
ncbi:hypothetical protein JXA05_02820, partial [Candidatus Peregrinibacteria bacterium]|nr:hypothetical protein [Candidatus Peregrinibacteria bacterium]